MTEFESLTVAAVSSLSGAVVYLWNQTRKLNKKESQCQKRLSRLEHDYSNVRDVLRKLQPVFVTASMPDGRIIEASAEIENLLGWEPEELLGKNVDVLIAEEFNRKHHEAFSKAIERRALREGTLAARAYARHKDGQHVPVDVSLTETSTDPWLVRAQIHYRQS